MLFSNFSHEDFQSNFTEVIKKWSIDDVIKCYRSLCIVVNIDNFADFPFADEVICAIDCINDYIFNILDNDIVLNAIKSVLKCSTD